MENQDETKALVEEYSRIFASILKEANKFIFDSDLDEKSLVAVRMIYAKILEIRKLLDGINYNYIEEETEKAAAEAGPYRPVKIQSTDKTEYPLDKILLVLSINNF